MSWWFPYCPLFLSFQVGILLAKEENSHLRQEKQMLKKKLEEVRKRVVWEDLVTVTECGHAGLVAGGTGLAGGAAGERSWALRDDWHSSSARARSSSCVFGTPGTAGPQQRLC